MKKSLTLLFILGLLNVRCSTSGTETAYSSGATTGSTSGSGNATTGTYSTTAGTTNGTTSSTTNPPRPNNANQATTSGSISSDDNIEEQGKKPQEKNNIMNKKEKNPQTGKNKEK